MSNPDIGVEFVQRQRDAEQRKAQSLQNVDMLMQRAKTEICNQLKVSIDTFNSHRSADERKLACGCHDTFIMVGGILPGLMILFERDEVAFIRQVFEVLLFPDQHH